MAFWLNCFYIVVLAWAMYYVYASLAWDDVPWRTCDKPWNTIYCKSEYVLSRPNQSLVNQFYFFLLSFFLLSFFLSSFFLSSFFLSSFFLSFFFLSFFFLSFLSLLSFFLLSRYELAADYRKCALIATKPEVQCYVNTTGLKSPVTEFWENQVLQITTGLHDPGNVRWPLALTLGIAWIACYFCIWKGVKWTGKVCSWLHSFPEISYFPNFPIFKIPNFTKFPLFGIPKFLISEIVEIWYSETPSIFPPIFQFLSSDFSIFILRFSPTGRILYGTLSLLSIGCTTDSRIDSSGSRRWDCILPFTQNGSTHRIGSKWFLSFLSFFLPSFLSLFLFFFLLFSLSLSFYFSFFSFLRILFHFHSLSITHFAVLNWFWSGSELEGKVLSPTNYLHLVTLFSSWTINYSIKGYKWKEMKERERDEREREMREREREIEREKESERCGIVAFVVRKSIRSKGFEPRKIGWEGVREEAKGRERERREKAKESERERMKDIACDQILHPLFRIKEEICFLSHSFSSLSLFLLSLSFSFLSFSSLIQVNHLQINCISFFLLSLFLSLSLSVSFFPGMDWCRNTNLLLLRIGPWSIDCTWIIQQV